MKVRFGFRFNNISVILVAVSFIGGGNRRKPPTCRKSLTKFIIFIKLKSCVNIKYFEMFM